MMALSVADNLRRCIERFGSTVANPTRSRSMMQRSSPRYMAPASQPKAETTRDDKGPKVLPPAD